MPTKHILDLRKQNTDEGEGAVLHQSQEAGSKEESSIAAWDAPEFEKRHKDAGFWIVSTVAATALVAFLLLVSRDLIGVVTITLAAIVWLLYAFKEPKVMRFALTPRGFMVGQKIHIWEQVESFWIFFDPPGVKEISFQVHGLFAMHVVVPLGGQDPVEIRKNLLLFIPEVEQKISAIDLLMRRIGF